MTHDTNPPKPLAHLMEDTGLAAALDSDHFKQFLDHIPVAIAVASLKPQERVTYANLEFEELSGQSLDVLVGSSWEEVDAIAASADDNRKLCDAIREGEDHLGVFQVTRGEDAIQVDAWANVIEDEAGTPMFRLVALAATGARDPDMIEKIEERVREKDTQLRELQHRVKNNLQMITALIRLESRNMPDDAAEESFERLAGRIGALGLLYRTLGEAAQDDTVDLGIYLSQVASAVMQAHAVEGIRLEMKVDTWPVSINVAMPTGLVVNEIMTNSLKHAFAGREGGTITLQSLVDADGCQVILADDGVGLPPGQTWPIAGRLGALIVQSLRDNAKAQFSVASEPGAGVRVTIRFARAAAKAS
ncbi:sensor histidine kinase [Plastoroseomonas arctica]|uniref:histidine kinase n=1 Tax=Plastoroseomonas arctica TaxID=1509237 RepID=A0AAF1JU38_9PROT|nr:histidine kinase dimerization/phosphoacceptor domain -containing protein [Plastoroseomonas arctica]MBR0653581.1 PAS domain-containing protein [Plastoroseomonas arctica]